MGEVEGEGRGVGGRAVGQNGQGCSTIQIDWSRKLVT